jgi:hypothetical protein
MAEEVRRDRSPTLQARVAVATLTRKGPERQRLARPPSKMPLGLLQQGPLTARLWGGGEGPEEEPEIDAKALSKEEGEPDETMPEPEEPAGTKPGLQVLPGTKNRSPGGRQTRSMTDALLQVDETEVGKSKSSVVMPKGFGELPQTDPQYQEIQGFNFGDFPSLGGKVSKDTTSNVTKGAEEAPAEDIGIVKPLEEEIEAGSRMAPDLKGKAKEPTAAEEGVSHIFTPVGLQKRRQPLRSKLAARLSSADPDLAPRTWLKGRVPSSGVLRLRRVRSKPRFTTTPILIGLTI